VSSIPADGSQIEAGIAEIRLTFSAELMQISESAEIIVTDPAGALINNGCAMLQGTELTTSVDFETEGIHNVSWRVVSGDGHPIEGSFAFEVLNPKGHVSAGIVPGTECDWAITEWPPKEENENPSGWVYWLLWLALPIGGIGLHLWLRPRPRPNSSN
jgi:methionine-rich copper-binding protein CopC